MPRSLIIAKPVMGISTRQTARLEAIVPQNCLCKSSPRYSGRSHQTTSLGSMPRRKNAATMPWPTRTGILLPSPADRHAVCISQFASQQAWLRIHLSNPSYQLHSNVGPKFSVAKEFNCGKPCYRKSSPFAAMPSPYKICGEGATELIHNAMIYA